MAEEVDQRTKALAVMGELFGGGMKARKNWIAVVALAVFAAGCAAVPVAEGPIDWASADERWSILVVTVDPDGDDRVTRIWMALLDGEGVLRTNESRWWANLERDPRIRVRHAGKDHPFRVEVVTDPAERARIDAVFVEKYGTVERMMFPQEPGETHVNYARVRPAG